MTENEDNMFKKIKKFFAAEKYEEKLQGWNIRPEYKDNLGVCYNCGWVFRLNDMEPLEKYGSFRNEKLTMEEFFSINIEKQNDFICERCKNGSNQLVEEFKAKEKLKKVECEKFANIMGIDIGSVIYIVDKMGGEVKLNRIDPISNYRQKRLKRISQEENNERNFTNTR